MRTASQPAAVSARGGGEVRLNRKRRRYIYVNGSHTLTDPHNKVHLEEGELRCEATVKESLTVRQEGKRSVQRQVESYNLDVIISVESAEALHKYIESAWIPSTVEQKRSQYSNSPSIGKSGNNG